MPSPVLPRASDILLSGAPVEGETLEAKFHATGGFEGQNSIKWFRGSQKEEGVTIVLWIYKLLSTFYQGLQRDSQTIDQTHWE